MTLPSAEFLISLQLVPQTKHVVFHLLVFYLLHKGVCVSAFWFPGILFCTKLLVPAVYILLSVAKMCSILLRTEVFQCCMMSRSGFFSPVGFRCLENLPLLSSETTARGVDDSIVPDKSQFENSGGYLQFISRTHTVPISWVFLPLRDRSKQ